MYVSTGHSNFVSSVVFSVDGKTIISGSWDNSIKIWQVPDVDDNVNLATYGMYMYMVLVPWLVNKK